MSDLKLVEIYPSNYRDVVATLRLIATEIEQGRHGEVRGAALVLDDAQLTICGAGERPSHAETVHLLYRGLHRLSFMSERPA